VAVSTISSPSSPLVGRRASPRRRRSSARRNPPSALSHTIRELEARLGVRLLNRTTRSVAPTEAGERLIGTLGPRFDEIDAALATASELRKKPAGSIRITATEYAMIIGADSRKLRTWGCFGVSTALAQTRLAALHQRTLRTLRPWHTTGDHR
jgi:hypothetical protein